MTVWCQWTLEPWLPLPAKFNIMNRKIPKNNSLDINVSYILFQADVFQQKTQKREKEHKKE